MGEILEKYKQDGFYIARSLLNEKDIHNVRQKITNIVAKQIPKTSRPPNNNDTLETLKLLHQFDTDRYKRTVGALWRMFDVYELMHSTKITGFLKNNFGWSDLFIPGGQVVHIMAEELKIPNGYFGLVPHQDFPSVQGSLDGVVVWLPLVNVDKNNYPLEVIPGSHKCGLLPSIENSNSTWQVKLDRYSDADFIPAEVNVGDVIFMSVFTIHRSSTNGTPNRIRLAASTRYDNANEATFIDRSYPSAYIRTIQREQYFQNFPSTDQVLNTFR